MVKHIKEKYKNERYKKNILEMYTEITENIPIALEYSSLKDGIRSTELDLSKTDTIEHYASDPLKDLNKFIKKIETFFKDIEKFFKKVKKAFTFTQKKMIAVISTIVIPFFGQIIGRIMLLDGSLDKPWLLLFGIPPLTLLPAFFMMFGLIKKGKAGKPWDKYILIPIIINIISSVIFKNSGIKGQVIRYILLLSSFVFIYWLRSKKTCKKSARYTKIITDSLITYSLMEIMKIVLEYVPLIGIAIKVIEKTIPFGYLILDAFSILCVYIITNMINSTDSKKFCKKEVKNKYIGILILISIIITYKNYSSLNKTNTNINTNINIKT
jgi:hypothetical protein